ncbi:hypothetical protein TNCV_3370691 [Trichonephila clavipes]|nr:hypothetical protein TNCV_3370691 [Trichonephila clavipes]
MKSCHMGLKSDCARGFSFPIGDGLRTFEPRSSDERDATPLSKLPHPINGTILSLDRLNVHRTLYTMGLQRHQDSNTQHSGPEFMTMTPRLPKSPELTFIR